MSVSAKTDVGRPSRAEIAEFLSHKRLALVGVSRNGQDFTRSLMREFEGRGYETIPVNPGAAEIAGRPCYARVQDIQPPVSAVLVLTPPATTEQVARDCAAAGVTHVWMHRGGGFGAVSETAVAFCRQQGIKVIAGECPMMFLPQSGFPHRVHALVKRIFGTYPR